MKPQVENTQPNSAMERTASQAKAKERPFVSEESLEERLKFETLLAEMSARFVNLPADRVDGEITTAQRRICELLDIDRATLWQINEGVPGTLLLTHIHQPPDSPTPPDRMNARDYFPWTLQKVIGGETIAISKMTDLPAEADRDLESYRLYGSKSNVLVPLSVGGGPLFGLFTVSHMREERYWSETIIKGFQLIAGVFANALARTQAEKALRESEARLSLATNAAGAGLWILESDTGHVWASEKIRELFHFSPDEELNYESFFKVIHPDDREHVNQAVQKALQSGEYLLCDYRIVLPDGNTRWTVSRGQKHLGSDGGSNRLMGVSIDITHRKRLEGQLRERLQEIEELKERLERENIYLQEEVKLLVEHSEIVGQSAAMKRVLTQAEQVAGTDSTVLILGETGTGKELLARAIHRMGSRKDKALITVNCASLPLTLIESELFGREKGAYTGALTKMVGRFELADGSTLFLDEIGELPNEVQSKLLRVLEEGRFERLGSAKSLQVNVRIIAATNRNLNQAVKEGKFRKDLYYRLNVFPIEIPPLRERQEDIPLLVWAFVREFEKKMGKRIDSIPKQTMDAMQTHPWPGNVRELRNVIERSMIICRGKTLDVRLPRIESLEAAETTDLEGIERRHVLNVLEKTSWRIGGKGGAAEALGLKRTTLQSLMKRLGIERPT
jgi:PAS domain S-box-containing protein